MEDLKDILSDKGWNVDTVTVKLGPEKEDRSDENILKYAKKTNCIVVTIDRPFVSRLRASGIQAVALDMNDRSRIINEKLEKI